MQAFLARPQFAGLTTMTLSLLRGVQVSFTIRTHGRPQDASIPCQTSVRGFDNYDAESVAWGSGQLYNQDPRTPSGCEHSLPEFGSRA
ncbi:hypothetical protein PENNAL_c0174G02911, partial [Penicillium nalgiovense]